jgi:hypothetical protein
MATWARETKLHILGAYIAPSPAEKGECGYFEVNNGR